MIPRKTVFAAAIVIAVAVLLVRGTFRGDRAPGMGTVIEPRLLGGAGAGDKGAAPQIAGALLKGETLDEKDYAALFDMLREPGQEKALLRLEGLEDEALEELMERWVRYDAKGGLAALLKHPGRTLRYGLGECFILRAKAHAPAFLLEQDGWDVIFDPFSPSKFTSTEVLREWAARDYADAEKWVLAQPDTLKREEEISTLLLGYTDTLEKAEAVDFILARPDNEGLQWGLSDHIFNWMESDGEVALERLRSIPADHPVWDSSFDLGRAAAELQNRSGEGFDVATLIGWGKIFEEPKARQQYLGGAGHQFVDSDNSAAQAVVNAMTEDNYRVDLVESLSSELAKDSPAALSEWLAELPESPSRDAGVLFLVDKLIGSDLESARQWAESISDAETRVRALDVIESRGKDRE